MSMRLDPKFAQDARDIAARAGIVFPGVQKWLPRERYTADARGPSGETTGWGEILINELDPEVRAFDAEPTLITTPNAGVPNAFTTYFDPKLIEVILTPNNAVKIVGEVRKGDWTTDAIGFPMVESTGEVTSYGDFNDGGGRSGANVQWEYRQPYLWQSFTEWGDREVDRMGKGRVDWVARLRIATAMNHDKFYNNSLFYGIANLQCYGLLNDPSLSAAITPNAQTTGTTWSTALPTEILSDAQKMFGQLQVQTGSNLELDTPMVLALHSVSENYLANTNSFGLTAMEMIKKVYPNLRVQQAPQYLSGTTYSCQLIVDAIQGQKTVEGGFNEKMRGHRMVLATSSVRQKTTGGTDGALLYMPIGIVTMTGI